MNTPEPTMNLQGRRVADRKLSESRREARRDYERYAEQEANAERDYRKQMSVEFAKAKGEGLSDKRAEIDARAAVADVEHRRNIAHSLVFSARMRIAELERDAVSVRDIHSTSERIDGVVAT